MCAVRGPIGDRDRIARHVHRAASVQHHDVERYAKETSGVSTKGRPPGEYIYLFTGRLSDTKKQGRRGRPSTRSGSAWLPTRGQSVPRAARPHAPHDLSTSRCRSKMPSLHGGRRRLSDMEREPPSRRGIGGGRRPGDLFAAFGAPVVETAHTRRAAMPRCASHMLCALLTVVCACAAPVQEAVPTTSKSRSCEP